MGVAVSHVEVIDGRYMAAVCQPWSLRSSKDARRHPRNGRRSGSRDAAAARPVERVAHKPRPPSSHPAQFATAAAIGPWAVVNPSDYPRSTFDLLSVTTCDSPSSCTTTAYASAGVANDDPYSALRTAAVCLILGIFGGVASFAAIIVKLRGATSPSIYAVNVALAVWTWLFTLTGCIVGGNKVGALAASPGRT